MSAPILGVFALLMWAAALSLPVSPDKLALEVGGLGLLATAAYTGYCFGVRGLVAEGGGGGVRGVVGVRGRSGL